MDAEALRELIRGLLPWLDDKTRAKVTGEIIDRAARSESEWTPAAPTNESVGEVLEFTEAAQFEPKSDGNGGSLTCVGKKGMIRLDGHCALMGTAP